MPWNLNEQVTLIKQHQGDYLVIVLQEVDGSGRPLAHVHSIVCNVGDKLGRFDVAELLSYLTGTHLDFLADEFEAKFWPWNPVSSTAYIRRVAVIFLSLDRCALASFSKNQQRPTGKSIERNIDAQKSAAPPGSGSARAQPQFGNTKRKATKWIEGETSTKRTKSNPAKKPRTARSSGSILTDLPGAGEQPPQAKEDHKEFTKYQKEFWDNHQKCFLFDGKMFDVSIEQCILAKDTYVVKKKLVELGDAKTQRRKLYLTPIDENDKLLKSAPNSWDDIKSRKFMIINGQHNIMASKELQIRGCGEKWRKELQTWNASIVWTLDAVKLTNISEFYNKTNHINHAQPTWGNQIISLRNVWVDLGRPCLLSIELEIRKNAFVPNIQQYAVSPRYFFISLSR